MNRWVDGGWGNGCVGWLSPQPTHMPPELLPHICSSPHRSSQGMFNNGSKSSSQAMTTEDGAVEHGENQQGHACGAAIKGMRGAGRPQGAQRKQSRRAIVLRGISLSAERCAGRAGAPCCLSRSPWLCGRAPRGRDWLWEQKRQSDSGTGLRTMGASSSPKDRELRGAERCALSWVLPPASSFLVSILALGPHSPHPCTDSTSTTALQSSQASGSPEAYGAQLPFHCGPLCRTGDWVPRRQRGVWEGRGLGARMVAFGDRLAGWRVKSVAEGHSGPGSAECGCNNGAGGRPGGTL